MSGLWQIVKKQESEYERDERILAEAYARALKKAVEAKWGLADQRWGYPSSQPCRR